MWNIVVVDSDAKSVEVLEKLLEAYCRPYHVTRVFGDGEEAWRYLCENPSRADILITDICTPKLTGLELIGKVRASGWNLQCIIVSNYKVFEYAQRAMELNVSRYLLKPLEPESFYEAMDSLDLKPREDVEDWSINLAREISYLKREIERDYKEFDMNQRALQLGYSKEYLYRIFKQEVGVSVAEYLQDVRLSEAKRYLTETGKYKIYEISEMVGYKDHVHFAKLFKKKYQVSPKEFRKYGQNDEESCIKAENLSD